MELDIKFYIDFKKLFVDLYNLHETELMQHRADDNVYMDIINFYMKDFETFEIMIDECQYNENEIIFVFGYDFNDSNESNSQSSTADYTIVFDIVMNKFNDCYYQQG